LDLIRRGQEHGSGRNGGLPEERRCNFPINRDTTSDFSPKTWPDEGPHELDREVARVRVFKFAPRLKLRIRHCPQSFLFEREEEAHQRCLGIDISSQPIL